MDTEVFVDDIDYYFHEYCDQIGVDEYELTPLQWSGALMYIYNHTFKIDNSNIRPKNRVSYGYDMDAVNNLLDRYILLAVTHNQRISASHFCTLSGINPDTLNTWRNQENRSFIYVDMDGNELDSRKIQTMDRSQYRRVPSSRASDIWKKLARASMTSVEDLTLTKQTVASIAIMNRQASKYDRYFDREDIRPSLDSTELAARLGIQDKLKGLPKPKTEIRDKNTIIEVLGDTMDIDFDANEIFSKEYDT